MDRLLLLLVVAAAAGYPVFRQAQRRARVTRQARTALLVRSVIGLVMGGVLALVLPQFVPETPGSPATIVALLLLWIVGGGLAFLSLAALAGALTARPGDADEWGDADGNGPG